MSSSVPEVSKYSKVEPLVSSLNKRVYEEIMAEAGLQPEASLSLPSEPCDEGAHAETGGQDCKEEGQNCQLPATSSSVQSDAEQDISRLDLIDRKLDACVEQVIDALKNHAGAPKFVGLAPDEKAHNSPMTEVTRELLDAKLDSVRAEVRASIAESSKETVAAMGQLNTQMATMQGQMLTEMQSLRAEFSSMAKEVAKELAVTNVGVAQLNGKVEGLDGKVDGLKSSVSMLQTVIGYGIGVAGVIVAIGAIAVAWMQLDFAKKTTTTSAPVAATAQASNERVAPSAPNEQKKTGG